MNSVRLSSSAYARSLLLPLVLLGRAGAPAQEASAPDPAPFSDTLRVELVNVDVRVTDEHGEPVRGLAVSDFEVHEDGRPVAITHFAVVEDRHAPSEARAAPSEADPSARTPQVEGVSLPEEEREDLRLRLVLFFDNYNVRPLERNRVLRSVESFVRRALRDDDLAMVVSYDRAIEIRQHFTNDTNLVAKALAELEDVQGFKTVRDRERQQVLSTVDGATNHDAALTAVRNHAEVVFNEMGHVVQGLEQVLDHLAGLPGRKALLHVSGGMPMIAADDLFYAVHEKFAGSHALGWAARYDLSRSFREVQNRANANDVTFYTLDAGGLRANTAGSAEYQGLRTAGLLFRLESDYQANLQAPLRYLAEETGGRAIVDQNDVSPALERVARDLRTFYSLGYTPAHAGDGRYHDIRVEVKRKGTQVRHRSGYLDKSSEARMIEGTTAALVHSYERNPLGISIEVERQQAQEDGTYRVGLLVRVPMEHVAILPMGDASHTRLRFFVAVMDDEGRSSGIQQLPIALELRPEHVEAAQRETYLHRQQLLMRSGRQKVAVGVNDELSGQAAFAARVVAIGG